MDIAVTFRHLEPNDALREYAQEKISRIEKYSSTISEAHAILSIEKRSHIAEVIVNVNKAQITAKEISEDNMCSAIDLVMDKIERQVKKHKDKLTSHKELHRKARHNVFAGAAADSYERPSIVKTESVFIEAMSPDDAIKHISEKEDDFFVFRNSDTEKVSVLYRRRDGDLGLIEPENT